MKNESNKQDQRVLNESAKNITKAVVQTVEDLRDPEKSPNYLLEYVAFRFIVDQYEHYLMDIIEKGPDAGGLSNVGYS